MVLGFVIHAATDIPSISYIENPQTDLSTQVISADGQVLQNLYYSKNRVNVQLNEISPYAIDALIATEDARFYSHSGVDYTSMPSLIMRNLIKGTKSGGSTITMQLSRNLFDAVGRQRTLGRKIREIIVSAILEKNFTKEEILVAYLNTVSIYGQTYGIEMAAQRLLNKSAKQLAIEEAAMLVGMLKGSGVFNPFRNPDTVLYRRNLVLSQMLRHQMIDTMKLDLDSVKQIPIQVVQQEQEHVRGLAPYFRQHLKKFLKEWCDERGINMYTDGLKIHTTIDSKLQRFAEKSVADHIKIHQGRFEKAIKGREAYKKDTTIITDLMRQTRRYQLAKKENKTKAEIWKEFNTPIKMQVFNWDGDIDTVLSPFDSLRMYSKFLEAGFVSMEPTTGHIKAWVGGINFKHFKYDHVAKGKRQVGSTFKPFVYGAAFESNARTPCDVELNQPVYFDNTDGEGTRWAPKNSDGSIGGLMTLRRALATSTNLITARLMKSIRPRAVADFAYRAGIKSKLEEVPALCLGTPDLNVLELTNAYSSFVNDGEWIEPLFITRIEDKNGNVIAEFHPQSKQAFSKNVSEMMVEMLRGVVDEPGGTASRLRYAYNMRSQIGGKTGTTQNQSDGWYIGISPSLVSGVWVGCSDRRMHFEEIEFGQGAAMALPIWGEYMKKVYADEELHIPEDEAFYAADFQRADFNCDEIGNSLDAQLARDIEDEESPSSSDDFDDFD